MDAARGARLITCKNMWKLQQKVTSDLVLQLAEFEAPHQVNDPTREEKRSIGWGNMGE